MTRHTVVGSRWLISAFVGVLAFAAMVLVWLGGRGVAVAEPVGAASGAVEFNRDIRPILTDNCYRCHGPDPGSRKVGMRFDREEGLFEKREHGQPVVKGKPAESLMYQRITSTDPEKVMPKPESHKVLTAGQKEMIRKWIEQGAVWQAHWAFVAPQRPAVPAVKNEAWARNPIDRFVLAKLEAQGLTPAPEADRRTLARRAALDATGLPPDEADLAAFAADKSPDAYERYVKKLLDSPAYGEHRARYWLDAARYADTHGLHFDNYREIWPYRDWVINAFNKNMPFDQFTIEQLAGDLLPDRSIDQQIASGFNRCNVTTNEGGTIPEENLVMYTRDRTETVARIWLGLTANCAVCHDHKFDPITQKDFYSLSAFFNNLTNGPLDGNVRNPAPVISVVSSAERAKFDELTAKLPAIKAKIETRGKEAQAEFEKWLATASRDSLQSQIPSEGLKLLAPLDEGDGTVTKIAFDGQSRSVPLTKSAKWNAGHNAARALQTVQGSAADLTDAGDFDNTQAFTCAVWAKLPQPNLGGAIVARMDDRHGFRGWDLWLEGGKLGSHIISNWPDNAIKVVSTKPIDHKVWNHLCITYDGSGKTSGVKVYVNGEEQPTGVQADSLSSTIRTTVPFKIGQRDTTSPIDGLVVQDLRLYGRAITPGEVVSLAKISRMSEIVAKPADKRSDAEKKELLGMWLGAFDTQTREMTETLTKLQKELAAIGSTGGTTLVSAEKPTPAKAYILTRGDYDKRGLEVKPDTFKTLPPMDEGKPHDRLAFAQWLMRPDHPLTARVTVNRYWQEIFGVGLVKTAEDFGIMGESPSHPELLDWLAVEFRESGWDTKKMIALILTSATYRQSAVITPEKLQKDLDNRLLSRGPRFRMDGEMVRDTALAASGLLVRRIGGPSVRPYQPPGIWDVVGMSGGDTRNYVQSKGEGLYRRSVYTFWKRMATPASMDIFNAPARDVCTVRRERTNTPLQALVTLNDPQFIEASRHLAELAMKEAGKDDEARADWIARRLMTRSLSAAEHQIIGATAKDLLAFYTTNPAEAAKLIAVGDSKADATLPAPELATWTLVASDLMNLDETLNK